MKTSHAVIVIVVVAFLAVFALQWSGRNIEVENNLAPSPQTSPIAGCYIAGASKDVYTLNIQSQEGESVSGTLAFKNFEKDSSSGSFVGTYKNGVLLGDYAFQSEGTNSVMQVIFKKAGDDFIRGYGEVNSEGDRFADLNNITYDSSSPLFVFKKGECSSVSTGIL